MGVNKGILLLIIAVDFILIPVIFFLPQGKQKWFMKQTTEESTIGRKLSDHKINNTPDADWLQLKPLAGSPPFIPMRNLN